MGSARSNVATIVEAAATARRNIRVSLISVVFFFFAAANAFAQGGPPYYTNDPGTPGPFNWEINLGYMPFLYSDQSVSHTPDVDINFGVGERDPAYLRECLVACQESFRANRVWLGSIESRRQVAVLRCGRVRLLGLCFSPTLPE